MQARSVLASIGAGERCFANINRHAGGLQQTSLSRSLTTLTRKRVVAADRPLSVKPSKETRYRVADPYLRFWLAFLGPYLPEVERGRGDRVAARIRKSWTSWRGRAIEPVVRESLERLPSDDRRVLNVAVPAELGETRTSGRCRWCSSERVAGLKESMGTDARKCHDSILGDTSLTVVPPERDP